MNISISLQLQYLEELFICCHTFVWNKVPKGSREQTEELGKRRKTQGRRTSFMDERIKCFEGLALKLCEDFMAWYVFNWRDHVQMTAFCHSLASEDDPCMVLVSNLIHRWAPR